VGRFGDVRNAGRKTLDFPTQRDELDRLAEREQTADETIDVAADAGSRRTEGASIEADANHVSF
jgi:hypothetical protein